jgi:hypothetical protein
MDHTSDTDHCSVIQHIIEVCKGATNKQLCIFRTCHNGAITLEFGSKAERDAYFTDLVAKITAYTPA